MNYRILLFCFGTQLTLPRTARIMQQSLIKAQPNCALCIKMALLCSLSREAN